jgi:hypothetical protein
MTDQAVQLVADDRLPPGVMLLVADGAVFAIQTGRATPAEVAEVVVYNVLRGPDSRDGEPRWLVHAPGACSE